MLLLLFFCCVFARYSDPKSLIDEINNSGVEWVAEENKFTNWAFSDLQQLCACDLAVPRIFQRERWSGVVNDDLPDNFDTYQKWPTCAHPVRNQGQCGSCWAHGSTEALSDRFCIASEGKVNVILAPQDPVSCDPLDQGCGGGIPWISWEYAEHDGIVEDSCFPYVSGDGNVPKCEKKCHDSEDWKESKHYAKGFKHVHSLLGNTEKEMQQAMYSGGSLSVAFTVYQDFMSYSSGVYTHTSGAELGGHVVLMTGWGVNENGTKYWICKNSWGDDWGMDGFFWINRGTNECGMEDSAYAPEPDLDQLPKKYML